MDIHRLEVFCRVVDLQSFTKAAEAVYLTQPTVSEHVRALEEMVGESCWIDWAARCSPLPRAGSCTGMLGTSSR